MNAQEKWHYQCKKEMEDEVRESAAPYVGLYPTFKEARKAAREIAGHINVEKDGYRVGVGWGFEDDYFVHQDGRVCMAADLLSEERIWERHGKQGPPPYPFVSHVRNRKPGEDKQEYQKQIAIGNRHSGKKKPSMRNRPFAE